MRCWEFCATKPVPQDTRDLVWTVINSVHQIGPTKDSSADFQNTDVVEVTLGNLETVWMIKAWGRDAKTTMDRVSVKNGEQCFILNAKTATVILAVAFAGQELQIVTTWGWMKELTYLVPRERRLLLLRLPPATPIQKTTLASATRGARVVIME